jgi:hypothetical protein
MIGWKKWLAVGVGTVIVLLVALVLALWVWLRVSSVPSKITDFRPTSFPAKAESKFFYSIGNELKYSDQIDPSAPTLITGKINNFLVSPDGKKITIVANGYLTIIGTDSALGRVASVDSIYRDPKPIGKQFFRDEDFQWSSNSKVLYVIRDEYYSSRGSQLYSSKGELWRFDTESAKLDPVLKPFPAFSYFFGAKSIYFSTPTDRGDLQLRCFNGNGVTDVGEANAKSIPVDKLSQGVPESPFYSFSINEYERAALPSYGVRLVEDGNDGPQRLVIGGKSYLALSRGMAFKGPYYCSELLRSVFLPGDRYFLFNVFCGNYNGQLLIDTVAGNYERLPGDSVVYLTLNTQTYSRYRIAGEGIVIE